MARAIVRERGGAMEDNPQENRRPNARVAIDAAKMRATRIARGWTQQNVAYRAQVDYTTVNRIENNHAITVTPGTKQAIEKTLAVDLTPKAGDE
jgi:DNA-binding XRE family transcriptional regulator